MQKVCTVCKEEKFLKEYYSDPRLLDGKTSACKKCIYSKQVRYRDKNYFMTCHHNKSSECRRKSIDYNLDKDYLESIWTGYCPVFDIELKPRGDRHSDSTPHLDRINPKEGYIKGNVRFISRKANLIKSNANWEDILKVANWLKRESETH